jgi:hypothetical protein
VSRITEADIDEVRMSAAQWELRAAQLRYATALKEQEVAMKLMAQSEMISQAMLVREGLINVNTERSAES